MNIQPVANCTLIIRSQVEYSATTQTVVLRCLLEKSTTGQRRGFTEVEALLAALRAELMELQHQIVPPDAQKSKNPAEKGATPSTPDAPVSTKDGLASESGSECTPKDPAT